VDAQGDCSGGADDVVSDPVVGVGVAARAGHGLGHGVVERCGGRAVPQGPLGSGGVVLVSELVEQCLQLDDVPVAELLLVSVATAAMSDAGQADGVDHRVVSQRGCGDAVLSCDFAERGEHDRGGDRPVGGHVQRVAGAVIEPGDDLDALGEGRGVGSWVVAPWRVKMRWMVARDSVIAWWWVRCQPKVSAPASWPLARSSVRRRSTKATVSGGVAPGVVLGRRDLGS
jgi:hypothetical protein